LQRRRSSGVFSCGSRFGFHVALALVVGHVACHVDAVFQSLFGSLSFCLPPALFPKIRIFAAGRFGSRGRPRHDAPRRHKFNLATSPFDPAAARLIEPPQKCSWKRASNIAAHGEPPSHGPPSLDTRLLILEGSFSPRALRGWILSLAFVTCSHGLTVGEMSIEKRPL